MEEYHYYFQFFSSVSHNLEELLVSSTTKLFTHHDKKDKEREISSSLCRFLMEQLQEEANEELPKSMDTVEINDEDLENMTIKVAAKATKKQVNKSKAS